MRFFKNRAYQKAVLGWMRTLLEVGQGQYAEVIWHANPSLKECATAFRDEGEPAIVAAAELWRRVFTDQLLRAHDADRRAIYDYLTAERAEAPSRLAELCLGYCQALLGRGKVGDLDSGMVDLYVNDVLQAALGRDSAARGEHRLHPAFDLLFDGLGKSG